MFFGFFHIQSHICFGPVKGTRHIGTEAVNRFEDSAVTSHAWRLQFGSQPVIVDQLDARNSTFERYGNTGTRFSDNNFDPIEIYNAITGSSDLYLISNRTINPGSEVLWDYGIYYPRLWKRKSAIRCGEKLSKWIRWIKQR